ncbi:MAG: tetraacyldisaccharide 4'-kinase, partial [Cyclobacteriaceae bacterium]|nr:tetraacyldisaccharide 4'-kinase [Cyclobacteriaceae bacterium]
FSLLYNLITSIRNWAYNKNLRGAVKFETNVISIGNLEVGGTGKTPFTEYLIKEFKESHKIAVLSRGYMRKSIGFRIINESDNAETAGDEPFQIYLKFKKHITVAVSKERETAIPFILAERPEIDLFLLDDAFQYRTVKPSFSIVLSRFQRPFYNDLVMPSGRLREKRSNIKRADVVIITKCPEGLKDIEKDQIQKEIQKYTEKPVFFTTLKYAEPIQLGTQQNLPKQIILVTGIAHTDQLESYVAGFWNVAKHYKYPDHQHYTLPQIEEVNSQFGNQLQNGELGILLTEKDAVKWMDRNLRKVWENWPVFYLPVETVFLENESKFLELTRNSIKEYSVEE